jgi:hypothetical protein
MVLNHQIFPEMVGNKTLHQGLMLEFVYMLTNVCCFCDRDELSRLLALELFTVLERYLEYPNPEVQTKAM